MRKVFSSTLNENDTASVSGRQLKFKITRDEKTPQLVTWCRENNIIFDADIGSPMTSDQHEVFRDENKIVVFDVKACTSALDGINVDEINILTTNGVEFVHDDSNSLSLSCSKAIYRRLYGYFRHQWRIVSLMMEYRNGVENVGVFELENQCSDNRDKLRNIRDIMARGFMEGSLGMAKVLETIKGITLKTP